MIKWFVKKWILSSLNDLLEKAQEKCDIQYYREKILVIIKFLESLLGKFDDNKLTDEEVNQIIEEAKKLF